MWIPTSTRFHAGGVLIDYIPPEPWRTKYFLSHPPIGEQIYYDAPPDYAHAYAMRTDTFPPDGEFAGSDPDLAFRQLVMEAGADICILEPLAPGGRLPEASHASAVATNRWLDEHWLDSRNNWHQRWRGSITVAIEDPRRRGPRNRDVGGPPVHVPDPDQGRTAASWGDPRYDQVWAAATKHDITVSCHLGAGANSRPCPSRRSASPATTTTSWSPTRCWPRIR